MNTDPRVTRAAGAVLLMLTLALGHAAVVAQEPDHYRGRPLAEALRRLQSQGLRIVFTSAVVTPDLIVRAEPRATSPRRQLDELLAPHRLVAREGPGGIVQIVQAQARAPDAVPAAVGSIEGRIVDALTAAPLEGALVRLEDATGEARTDAAGRFRLRRIPAGPRRVHVAARRYAATTQIVDVSQGERAAVTWGLVPAVGFLEEHVDVLGPWPYRQDRGVAAETRLERHQWAQPSGTLADDPMRVVHALPRVAAVDDFRSDFAVRGSPFRHVDVVIDGMSTHALQHTVIGRGRTGSLGMLSSHVLEDATLRAGAYPRRYGDRLGPQLELTLREGSRTESTWRGGIGGTNVMLLGEGPLPGAAPGSWLVAARQSLVEWPMSRAGSTRTPFGFNDAFAKVVYDVRANQQVALSVLSGTSTVEEDEDRLAPNEMGHGRTRASALNFSWRSRWPSGLVLTQRAYLVTQQFLNQDQGGRDTDHGRGDEIVYRASLTSPLVGGLAEAGAQVGHARLDEMPRSPDATQGEAIGGSASERSAYAHLAWAVAPSLTLSPGVRLTTSTLVPQPTMTHWVLGEWAVRRNWTLSGSAGVSRQIPALRQALEGPEPAHLRPERARHIDLSIEQRLTKAVRWQVTAFHRHEDDVLREPDRYPRLVEGTLHAPDLRYVNALEGTAHGIELLVDRRSATGLSGWAAYSYGKTRHTDITREETFWSDADQRHTLNLFGVYRFSGRTSLGATLRAGSNVPIPGYLETREGALFAGSRRNEVRLPAYARVDVRGDRVIDLLGRRVTLFAEVWNATNRANAGVADGSVDLTTGEARALTERLSRRRLWVGALVEF